MKQIISAAFFFFVLNAVAQKNQLYVKSDVNVHTHTQADVDAEWKANYDRAKTAWDYYYQGNYETAIYHAERVSTAIIDKDYLYTQKTQILCVSYAKLGKKKEALQFYKKVQKKSPPDDIKAITKLLKSLGMLELEKGEAKPESEASTKLYYTPDPSDPTGMHNYGK